MKNAFALLSSALLMVSVSACQANGPLPLAAAPVYQAQASARQVYHVVHSNQAGLWMIKLQRETQAMSTYRTKEEAVAAGRLIARAAGLGQLIVHKLNGQIETEYTYGNDPATSHG